MLTVKIRNAGCDIEVGGVDELVRSLAGVRPADNPLPTCPPPKIEKPKKVDKPADPPTPPPAAESPTVTLLPPDERVAWVRGLASDPEKITLIRSMMGGVKVSDWPDKLQLKIRQEFVKRGWSL